MNRTHTSRAGTRTRSHAVAARIPPALLEPDDELEDVLGKSLMPEDLPETGDAEEGEWTEAESAPGWRGFRREAHESLAPELESELNLLLHGVSYR